MRRAACAGVVAASVFVTAAADAQVYTRRNANGVIEATNAPSDTDFRLTYPGKGTLIHSRGFRRAYSGQYDRDILDACAAHSVSTDLVRAVIAVESEFDAFAVSSKGAQGLMQLMPFTARRFGVNNPFDARQNIFGGVQYLRFLLDLFSGDVGLAVAAYNAGENAVQRFKGVPPFRETQSYVRKVRAFLRDGVPTSYASPVAMAASGRAGAATSRPLSYAPAELAPRAGARRNAQPLPVRPRTYYKFRDEKGVLHVSETAPAEGVLYATIRAFD